MTILLTDADAALEEGATDFIFECSVQPSYANFFDSLVNRARNLGGGEDEPWIVGAPGVTGQFMRSSSSNYVIPGFAPPAGDFAALVVAKPVADVSNEYVLANHQNNTTPGFAIYTGAATAADGKVRPTFSVVVDNAETLSASISLIGATTELTVGTPYALFCSYTTSTREQYSKVLTTGATASTISPYPRAAGSPNLARVGYYAGAGAGNPADVGGIAYWDGYIPTAAELATVYAQLQALYAGRGVTI